MFERADHILLERGPPFSTHVLSFHWEGFTPRLIGYDLRSGEVGCIPLDRLGLVISSRKQCVGTFDGDAYRPCPARRRVGVFPQCRDCASPWVPQQSCVFEPRCKGDLCDHPEFCMRLHVVYLAFYGKLVKVGMTSARRLRERAIEQGADAVAPLFRCMDRYEARQLEREVSARFKIRQELRAKTVAREWTLAPSRELIENNYDTYRRRIGRWRKVLGPELEHLRDYPLRGLPSSPPEVAETVGAHTGEVIGVKGRFLLFRRDGRYMMLDLSDLPSRFIRPL